MSRRHRARNNYPEGYAEHSVEMDWRKDRDADVATLDRESPFQDVQQLRAINALLAGRIDKTIARAELAEYLFVGVSKRVRIYVAASLIVGAFIGYFLRLIFA